MSETTADEVTPLLRHDERADSEQTLVPDAEKETPLMKVQLGILCLLRVLDPMCFTQIFPYINQFMSDLHVTDDPSQIGFYSGMVESSFAFAQLLSIYPWGYFSDRFGRRPVVLAGVAGLAVTTLLFGLSKTFVAVMVTRALAGLASGNVSVIPTILIEITDKSNQAFAFPFFGFWWPVGGIIGPMIGGLLSEPASRYPKYLGYKFLKCYPYFLPCLLVASFAALCFVIGLLFLKETAHGGSHKDKKPPQSHGSVEPPAPEGYNVKQLLAVPIIRALCVSGCALSFISTAFDVLFVLFCYTPVLAGGLAFSTSEIGFALSSSGLLAALLQVFFMPPVLRRVDHASLYHSCMKLWPYLFLALPLLNILARRGLNSETGQLQPHTIAMLWGGVVLILSMARVAFLAYSVNMLLVKRFAPNQSSLGSTTGLIQFSICFSRAFSPAFASSVFALSSGQQFLGGYLWVVVMASIGFTSYLFSKNIVKESSRLIGEGSST